MSGGMYTDPATEQALVEETSSYLTQVDAVRRSSLASPFAATQVSDFVRSYPGASPDVAAAVSQFGLYRDNPQLAEIIRRDYTEQGFVEKAINNSLGRITRPLTAMMYDAWDQSITRWLRFGVQTYQNPHLSWQENLGRAGTGIGGRIQQEVMTTDRSYLDYFFGDALGTGLIAGRSESFMEMPGAGRYFENALKRGAEVQEAITATEEWVLNKYGADVVNQAWDVADASQMHVTVDGVEYRYGVSPGRMAVTPMFKMEILTPHTVPANIISGGADIAAQLSIDPLDPFFGQMTRWASVRRALQPESISHVDQAIAANGGIKITQGPPKGSYVGEATPDGREIAHNVEGYAFFGGKSFDETEGLIQGGITLDADRAVHYARTKGGATGRVYAIKIDDLQPHLQKHLAETGDIEHYALTGPIHEAEQAVVDEFVIRIQKAEYEHAEAVTTYDQAIRDLRGQDPEFNAFMDDWDEWEAAGRPSDSYPGTEPKEYVHTHFSDEEAKVIGDLDYQKYRTGQDRFREIQVAKEENLRVQAAVGDTLGTPLNEEIVGGRFPVPIENSLDPADIEEMMASGYFFPEGRRAMESAFKYTEEELKIGKKGGRFEAKSPDEYLASGKGRKYVQWLADPRVPRYVKYRQMRSMGVPVAAIWGLIDDVDVAVRNAGMDPRKFEPPSTTFNDFDDAYGSGEGGGISNLVGEIKGLLDELDDTVGTPRPYSMDTVQIELSKFAKANPDIAKRVLHIERMMNPAYAPTPEKAADAYGMMNRKLRELLETIEKAEADDLAKRVAAQEEFDAIPPPASATEKVQEHITALVNNRLLTRQPKAPTIGRRMLGNKSTISGEAGVRDTPRPFSDWGRRWKAHSTQSKIDQWDFDTTFDTITQFLDTIGASPAAVDRIIRMAREGYGDFHASARVLEAMMDELEVTLRKRGYDEPAVQKIIKDYFDEQQKATYYNVDVAGNPIGEADSVFKLERTPGGLEFKTLVDQPILDSEMALSSIHVPSVRDARRVTARTRTLIGRAFDHPIGLSPTVVDKLIDGAAATWRNFQLLRPGWMLSVVPDEIARAAAQGHAELLGNPTFAWNVMMHKAGNKLPSGTLLDEVAAQQGGLGTGAYGRTLSDEPLLDTHAAQKHGWTIVETMDEQGNLTEQGAAMMARAWVRIYQSSLYQSIYRFDGNIEDAVEWLLNHPEGQAVVQDIISGQGRGAIPSKSKRLARIGSDDEEVARRALTIELEAIDAHATLYTGGDWLQRNPENPSQWLNSAGREVQTYDGINPETGRVWTKADLWKEIVKRDPEATGRYSRGGKTQNIADYRTRLMEMEGINIDLDAVPSNRSYVTIKQGDRNIRNVLSVGAKETHPVDARTIRRYALNRYMASENINPEDAYIIHVGEGGFDGHTITNGQSIKEPGYAADAIDKHPNGTFIVVDMTKVDEVTQLELMRASRAKVGLTEAIDYQPVGMRTIDVDDMIARVNQTAESADTQRIFPEMTREDFAALADYARNDAFAEGVYQPPNRVPGPIQARGEAAQGMGVTFIDKAFEMLGSQPSLIAARNPYSRIRTWEVFADYYMYATPDIQAQIRRAAAKSGVPSGQFDKFVARSMKLAGHLEMPKPALVQLTLDEIEQIAVTRAVQDTRDLFFDLSKRGNWADASKLVFPFGDAWWEVLTRWGALMNPMKAPEFGRPFKNLRRLQQFTMGAERSGWFETNERGERVFRWFPGAAIATAFMGNPEGFQMTNMASMNQIGFIDFSDTRAILGPGMGPYMQTLASLVRPKIEGTGIEDIVDWAVYGSFDPTEPDAEGMKDMLLPTYLRKLWNMVAAGEYDEKFASMQIEVANALYASGDPKYANIATDQAAFNMLLADAQRIVGTYGWIDALVSWVTPLQAKPVVQVVNADTDGSERVIEMVSVADDYRFLREYLEEPEALATIQEWYGEDPTMVAPKSYGVLQRPVTDGSYQFSIEYEAEMDEIPFTVGAFMPLDPVETFSSLEYQRQIDEGERQKLSVDEAFLYISYRQGQTRMAEMQDERDRRLLEAELLWGKDSDEFRDYRDNVVAPWYANGKWSLEAAYFGFAQGAGPTKLRKRPTSEQLLQEMLRIGTRGSTQNKVAAEMNSELTSALEEIAGWWNQNTMISIAEGHDASWWYSSSATTDLTTSQMRATFQSRVYNLTKRITNNDTRARVQWYADAVITPLMEGYDLDNPFIVHVDPLLAPET